MSNECFFFRSNKNVCNVKSKVQDNHLDNNSQYFGSKNEIFKDYLIVTTKIFC